MPILFAGPNGVIDVSLTPVGRPDRIEILAQELADECGVRIDAYHSDSDDSLEHASHLGVSCEPGREDDEKDMTYG